MRRSGKDGAAGKPGRSPEHVVFNFAGLGQPNLGDLSLIITARLQSAPQDYVWVRSLPSRTARIIELLHLAHLFRPYPRGSERLH